MNDYQPPRVVRHYEIDVTGRARMSHDQIRRFFEQAGLKVVSTSTGLNCGVCLGRGEIVNPAHTGCIVTNSDFVPCPADCDKGRPSDDVRLAAIRAGEV